MNIFLHNKKKSFNLYEEGEEREKDEEGKYLHHLILIKVYLYPKDKEKEKKLKH